MDCDENDNSSRYITALGDDENRNAVNSVILDYYKKIGRKRDLEQYFSLSTANSELRDPTGTFWRRMKSENDSSDSGEKQSENTSQEVCRISIRCSVPDPCSSQVQIPPYLQKLHFQEEDSKTKTESISPPIITEEVSPESEHNSDVESVKSGSMKSEDNQSQKSYDVLLDTSMNKPFSPTSSITSQRKLEWDSLADVGYANESDRKTFASNLSTLERLALIQQYSNNDNQSTNIGLPTAHSTPLDENEPKSKTKKGIGKKSTKVYQKDVDLVEVNVPECSNMQAQSINVNLTKHISFNVEKDGKVTIENIQKDVSVSPEKIPVESVDPPKPTFDKEIQTSLVKTREANVSPLRQPIDSQSVKIPVMVSLNTLRKRTRRKKMMALRKKLKQKKSKESVTVQEKSGEQLSEAESFEYMPGHIYNQNQLQAKEQIRKERPSNAAGNKSSLESSGVLTTDSSKSIHSFSKDLEKSIELLKNALKNHNDANLRKQLIKQICERLIKTKYRDEDSTSDFLSNFNFSSKKPSVDRNFTTTSTSDGNDSGDKLKRPKKSILRNDKFISGAIASTSQSAPNLSASAEIDIPAISKLIKQLTTSNTDSEVSSKEKTSSDTVCAKASSQELYQKYLAALRREQAYKQHLKDKEMFLRQKLGNSDTTCNVPFRDAKVNSRLKDLIKDLTRNNYDDGSGDASKLEGGPNSNTDFDRFIPIRNQRSHSVFTLSSGNSDYQNKKCNLKKRLQSNIKDLTKPGPSHEHYCCCPHHSGNKLGVKDSSAQVNMKIPYSGDSPNDGQRSRNASPRSGGRTEGSPRRSCSQNRSPRNNVRGDTSGRESGGSPRSRDDSPRSRGSSRKEPKGSPREVKCYCLCGTQLLQENSSFEHQCIKPRNGGKNEDKTSKKSSKSSTCSIKNRIMTTISDGIDQNKPIYAFNATKKTSKSSQTNLLMKMLRRQSSLHSGCSCSDEHAKDSSSSQEGLKTSPTYTMVYEATRCLQTEISINPKISEPTLSDVNIVTDSSCAKLISEGCRETIKPSTSEIYSRDACFSGSNKSSGTSKNIGNLGDQNNAITDIEAVGSSRSDSISNVPVPTPQNTPKLNSMEPNYKIPIQGTNMTLLVSVDSNEWNDNNQNKVSTCVGTDIIPKNEQGTSLAEECSKGVQYERVQSDNVSVDQNKDTPFKGTCAIFVANTGFNTYPKSPTNERPPFRRSTTDPNAVQQKSFADADIFKECPCGCGKMNCNCDANKSIVSKKTENAKNNGNADKSIVCKKPENLKNNGKCFCGCKSDKKKCGDDCSERKISESNNTGSIQSYKLCSCGCGQRNCTDKSCHNCDTKLPETKEKCSCGCSKNKDECGKACADCKFDTDGPCPCGCGGTKKNCHNACLAVRKEVGVQKYSPRDTTKEIQVNMSGVEKSKFHNAPILLRTEIKRMTKADDISTKMQGETCEYKPSSENDSDPASIDPIIEKIQSITKRYTKKDLEKSKRKKCFKEIMNVLNYLLDTEDSSDRNDNESGSGVGSSGETSDANIKRSQKSRSGSPKKNKNQENTPNGSPKNGKKLERTPLGSPKNDRKLERSPCGSPKNNKNREKTPCGSPKNNRNHETTPCGSPEKNRTQKITASKMSTESESYDMPKTIIPQEPPSQEKPKTLVEKGVQSCSNKKFKSRPMPTESSDLCSEIPGTSTDSATCKVLNKIKRECDRYHQRRCKIHGKKCDGSSTTSVDCDYCRRVHHCNCRSHKCKGHKKCHHEKFNKKPVAYNLIIQTSDSMMSEERPCDNRQLQNVVVKVPPKKVLDKNLPFKEIEAKIESRMSKTNRNDFKCCRSRSMPNESEMSLDEIIRKSQGCTVREYLEKNRPDFVKNSTDRLHCLKIINGSRETERAAKRDLLSLYVAQLSNVNELTSDELRQLANELGQHFRQKKPKKLISEREMKKHSEKIYKLLPEVVQKKEDAKKENEKKTNLLMASIFKKNLQKKTLRGSVNLSNYSSVIKI